MKIIKPYTKYKSSGIAWLGDIPEHWKVSKAKHILYQKKKTLNPNLNCGSISFGKIIYKDNDRVPFETKATYQELLKGEFLINPLNLNFDLKSLRTGLSTIDVVVSTGYIVLQKNLDFDQNYLKWLLHQFDVSFMKILGDGVRQTLSYSDFKNTDLPYIVFAEQEQIATFLDYKTAKIDRFISKKKQLIKLLNEQKAAIINDAVTKGLHANTNTKPSNIEWLGDIPAHWEVRKLKYSVNLNQHKTFDNEENIIKKIALENIESKSGKILELGINAFEGVGTIFKNGDVLFGKLRPYLAKVVSPDFEGSCVNEILVLTPNKEVWQTNFLKFRMLSSEFIKIVDDSTFGSKMPRASWDFIGGLKISCPSLSEQSQIVSYIEIETAKINKTILTIEKEIALVQEYRSVLIAEAVTGKIDVSGYVFENKTVEAPENEAIEEEDNNDFEEETSVE